MRVAGIIQARMGSTRLPGKVLRLLGDTTVLGHVIRRCRCVDNLDVVVVATTTAEKDAAIVSTAEKEGALVFRGSEEDVLDRYYNAARDAGAEVVVRITSDCPLLDPSVVRALVQRYVAGQDLAPPVDYVCNTLERTFPRGLDAEVFSSAALERAWRMAALPAEREHVTPYIYRHPELFRCENYRNPADLSSLRWTLDTEDDWRLLEAIFAELYVPGTQFSTSEVLGLLERRPELTALNAHVEQKSLVA